MTFKKITFLISLSILIAACKPVCPPDTVTTFTAPLPTDFAIPVDQITPNPVEVEIKGKTMVVDRVIHGPICNDTWRGVIYVACDVQVAAWEEDPIFFRDCALNIEENTVVYVASHNDAQYNKGCSCHE